MPLSYRFAFAAAVAISTAPLALSAAAATDDEVFTLYRNSAFDATMRIHVATFDTDDGRDYNAQNCQIAADLFGEQDGVVVRYWCEPGRYHER